MENKEKEEIEWFQKIKISLPMFPSIEEAEEEMGISHFCIKNALMNMEKGEIKEKMHFPFSLSLWLPRKKDSSSEEKSFELYKKFSLSSLEEAGKCYRENKDVASFYSLYKYKFFFIGRERNFPSLFFICYNNFERDTSRGTPEENFIETKIFKM